MALKFHTTGKRSNITKILKHSTSSSIIAFKTGKIDLNTLRNRASTKRIRDNMSESEKKAYDKKIYADLTEDQLEAKKIRNKKFRESL